MNVRIIVTPAIVLAAMVGFSQGANAGGFFRDVIVTVFPETKRVVDPIDKNWGNVVTGGRGGLRAAPQPNPVAVPDLSWIDRIDPNDPRWDAYRATPLRR